MKRSFTALAAFALLGALWALPAPAAAQTVGVIEYQIEYTPAEGWVVIAVVADPQAPLPVTVLIPVPEGATLMWSGEVDSDTNIDNDPPRTATLRSVNGVDAYEMTLENGYAAQLELIVDGGRIPVSGGDGRLVWPNPFETEALVYPAIVFPDTASGLTMKPAGTGAVQAREGSMRYSLEPQRVAGGGELVLDAGWESGAANGTAARTLPAWVFAALAAALVALVFAVVIDRTRARRRASLSAPMPDAPAEDHSAPDVPADDDIEELDW